MGLHTEQLEKMSQCPTHVALRLLALLFLLPGNGSFGVLALLMRIVLFLLVFLVGIGRWILLACGC